MNWLEYETEARSKGYVNICGVDEAGRGPLAGPVCAAAVILPEGKIIDGVNDSKKLTEKKRASMTEALRKAAGKTLKTDFSRPARTGMITKAKFHAVRMIQKQIGKTTPDTVDYLYWKGNGWLGKERPWKH